MLRLNNKPAPLTLLLFLGLLGGTGLATAGWQLPADTTRPNTRSRVETLQQEMNRPTTITRQPGEKWMQEEVSFVSEFVKRFNNKQGPDGQPLDSAGGSQLDRPVVLKHLFNADDARLKAQQRAYDPLYDRAVNLLIDDVLNDTAMAYLGAPAELLYARVDCEVIHKTAPQTLSLYLKQICTGRFTNWKIIGAEVPFLKATADLGFVRQVADSLRSSLDPSAHETNFLALVDPLTTGKNLLLLLPAALPPDPVLTTLAKSLLAGKVKFIQPIKTSVLIDTGHNWVLQLSKFIRETDNSGWLITDLYGPTIRKTLPVPLRSLLPASPSSSCTPTR